VPARRILITGVANPLGADLAARLAAAPGVERVVGVDTREPPGDLARRITHVRADVRAPGLGRVLRAAAVDTVVHNDIVQFPEPDRAARQLHDVNVIGTLQLLAAVAAIGDLRTLVVRGSAAIYGSEAGAPAFFTEDLARRAPLTTRYQRDVGELEGMFATFARRHPAVTCTMLRLQPVVGLPGSPIDRLFTAPLALTPLGFDARIQVIHAADAVGAMAAAVQRPVRGPVNVAADGVVSLRRMLRRLGRPALPVAGPLLGLAAGTVGRALGGPPLSEDVARYLRHGRGVDTTRMHEELRFDPELSTEQAIERVARDLRGAGPAAAAATRAAAG
jgi:UDP-glucose 4-epimerase